VLRPASEEVYRAYWFFAAERQRIFLRRADAAPRPWTDDPILSEYKFCNSYRASDRVSQFLIRDVIYEGEFAPDDLLMRIVLFRLFSKEQTWLAIERELGPVTRATLKGGRLAHTLERLRTKGPIYTNAFILCANSAFGHERKHLNHIELVRMMFLRGALPHAVARCSSLRDLYLALIKYPLIGPFMAYQLAIDINYSPLVAFDEDDFTVPGPGAERGIRKIFPNVRRAEMASIIRRVTTQQEVEAERFGIELPTLFGRRLHAIDIQNLFCEFDKYARVAFPRLKSDRRRIKTRFRPTPRPVELFYPPKWNINDQLPRERQVQLKLVD
jgi:hypothetical protein